MYILKRRACLCGLLHRPHVIIRLERSHPLVWITRQVGKGENTRRHGFIKRETHLEPKESIRVLKPKESGCFVKAEGVSLGFEAKWVRLFCWSRKNRFSFLELKESVFFFFFFFSRKNQLVYLFIFQPKVLIRFFFWAERVCSGFWSYGVDSNELTGIGITSVYSTLKTAPSPTAPLWWSAWITGQTWGRERQRNVFFRCEREHQWRHCLSPLWMDLCPKRPGNILLVNTHRGSWQSAGFYHHARVS